MFDKLSQVVEPGDHVLTSQGDLARVLFTEASIYKRGRALKILRPKDKVGVYMPMTTLIKVSLEDLVGTSREERARLYESLSAPLRVAARQALIARKPKGLPRDTEKVSGE